MRNLSKPGLKKAAAKAKKLVSEIETLINKEAELKEPHWGHVGTMNHAIELLEHLKKILT